VPNKPKPTALDSATPPTARAENGRFHARNAKETLSSPTAAKAATHGTDLFAPGSDCAHDASTPAAECPFSDPAAEFELTSEFEHFYSRYPRKKSPGFARRAWTKARKKAGFDEIMAGLEQYKFSPDPAYQPYPATWLNGERWRDQEPDLAADPWGLNAYLNARASLDWGWHVEALEEILAAAGLDRTWRGDLDTMAAWLTDGYRPDSIALVCAEEAASKCLNVNKLSWLDRTVRQRAFRWDANRCEWRRQRP
jgi:hypothetical protein